MLVLLLGPQQEPTYCNINFPSHMEVISGRSLRSKQCPQFNPIVTLMDLYLLLGCRGGMKAALLLFQLYLLGEKTTPELGKHDFCYLKIVSNFCYVGVSIIWLKLYFSDAEILHSGMIEIFLTVIKTCDFFCLFCFGHICTYDFTSFLICLFFFLNIYCRHHNNTWGKV